MSPGTCAGEIRHGGRQAVNRGTVNPVHPSGRTQRYNLDPRSSTIQHDWRPGMPSPAVSVSLPGLVGAAPAQEVLMRRSAVVRRSGRLAMRVAQLSVALVLTAPGAPFPVANAADGVWPQVPPPDFKYGHSAVYDRARHRMIVFGGDDGSLSTSNDVWVFELSYPNRWRRLLPTGTPPSPRRQHAAVYDAVHDRMIVFGGGYVDNVWHLNNEVWALELAGVAHWTQLTPDGASPAPRFSASVVYDPQRDCMLMYGGALDAQTLTADLWLLDLSGTPSWTLLSV